MDPLTLREHQEETFEDFKLAEEAGKYLDQHHHRHIKISAPSCLNEHQWKLTPQGYVGVIVLPDGGLLEVLPKITNLQHFFGMLVMAYDLDEVLDYNKLVDCKSIEAFYGKLAVKLAQLILEKRRRGLHRTFVKKFERLPFIRGKLDLDDIARHPWRTDYRCRFHDHTTDNEDNQILTYTLWYILKSGLLSSSETGPVQTAYQKMCNSTTVKTFTAQDCVGRRYDRVNRSYRPLHGLCRFFLENTGPEHGLKDHVMYPYMILMRELYQKYVTKYLQRNALEEWLVRDSERGGIGKRCNTLKFDIIIRDKKTGQVRFVIDTKYKNRTWDEQRDINQVFTYAKAVGCRQAVLVYPTKLKNPIDEELEGVRIRSLVFSVEEAPEKAGASFLQDLRSETKETPRPAPASASGGTRTPTSFDTGS